MIRSMSAGAEALVGGEAILELAAVDELHRDEPRAVVLVEIVDRDDVRMIEPARRLRFAAKARDDIVRSSPASWSGRIVFIATGA